MKSAKRLFSLLFIALALFVGFTQVVKADEPAEGVVLVSIKAILDDGTGAGEAITINNNAYAYGTTFNVEAAHGDEFALWIVDGMIDYERTADTTFTVTNNLTAEAIFLSEGKTVEFYQDHSGKYLGHKFDEETTIDEPNKVGYDFAGWVEVEIAREIEGLVIFRATYAPNEDKDQVTINENAYDFNSVVTLTASEGKVWFEGTKQISLSNEYTFSALTDRTLTEGDASSDVRLINLTYLTTFREDNDTYLVQIAGDNIVEYGLEINGTLRKATNLNKTTNEFIISVASDATREVRAYMIVEVEEGVFETFFDRELAPVQITHTVSFDPANGDSIFEQEVNDNELAIEPKEPERSGYIFGGWLLDGGSFDFNTPITGNITLVADWEEEVVEPVKLNPPVHGFGVSAHPDYHMGIGPYAEGGQEGFIGFGFVFTHNTTGVKYTWLVASNYNTGMAYWANAENLAQQGIVLPFGTYKVEYFARGNGTTHSDSDVSGASATMTVPKPNLAPFTININDQVVTWDAVDNATSYAIYVNGILESDNATSPFDLTSIVEPGEYVIKVVASAEDFNSSEAPTKTFIIAGDAPQLATPDNLVADGFNLTWDAVENAVSYNVTLGGVTVNVYATSYDLSKFDKGNNTFEVSVVAVGNIIDWSDSEAATLEVVLPALLPRLNALNTGDFVSSYMLNGVDNGHRKLEIYNGHAVYSQVGYTKMIRLGVKKSNGEMVYQDFDFNTANMQMIHTPGSTTSFFGGNLPASGQIELHFILVGDGISARDSLPLITTMNWQR